MVRKSKHKTIARYPLTCCKKYFYEIYEKIGVKCMTTHHGGRVDVIRVVPVDQGVQQDPVVIIGQFVGVSVLLAVLNLNKTTFTPVISSMLYISHTFLLIFKS